MFFNNDTLSIKEIIDLPVGRKRKLIMTAISESKYYYKDKTLSMTRQNIALPIYNNGEIQATLEEYKKPTVKNTDFKQLYTRLLVAGLSANPEALRYFLNFKKKFSNIMTSEEINDYEFLQSIFKTTF